MLKSKEELFIGHFIDVFKEHLDEIHPLAQSPNDFESGKSMAYYEIGSLIIECSKIFKVPLEDFNQDEIEKLI